MKWLNLVLLNQRRSIQVSSERQLFGMRKMNKLLKSLPTKRLGQQTLLVSFTGQVTDRNIFQRDKTAVAYQIIRWN
jgi:hypothetical protein